MPTIFLPFDSPYFRRPLLPAIPDDAPAIDTNAHTSQWKPIPAKTIQYYQTCITLQYQNKTISNLDNITMPKTIQYQTCITLQYQKKTISNLQHIKHDSIELIQSQ